MTLLCCFTPPLHRFGTVLRHTFALRIGCPQVELRIGITLFCQHTNLANFFFAFDFSYRVQMEIVIRNDRRHFLFRQKDFCFQSTVRARHGYILHRVKLVGVKFDFPAAMLARAGDVIRHWLGVWLAHIFIFKQSGHSNAIYPARPTQTDFGSGGFPRPCKMGLFRQRRFAPAATTIKPPTIPPVPGRLGRR